MAFNRRIAIPAFDFAEHDLSAYGETKDLGTGTVFHDRINFTFGDQPFDTLFVCHPLISADLGTLDIVQVRTLHAEVRKCQASRRVAHASVMEMEAREQSIRKLQKALKRKVISQCILS
jgi:hypothetical protein